MKEIKRKEVGILAGLCYESPVPLKLAKDLLKSAEKLSYENQTDKARMKEYRDLISFHANKI